MVKESIEEKVEQLEKLVQRTQDALEKKVEQLNKMVQRTQDVQEIQNVMSRHCFLHSQGKNHQQVMEIWALSMPDVSWNNHNQYIMVGPEDILRHYNDPSEKDKRNMLGRMTKLFPDIPQELENYQAGSLNMHTNCTPFIIVAGDGKTAKGTWDSPGYWTGLAGNKMQAAWEWVRYAVDFIKIDGKWKIWHFNSFSQFITPYEESWVTNALTPKIAEGPQAPEHEVEQKKISVLRHRSYNPKELCGPLTPNYPPQPVPYETFSETFSYGPPS